MNLLRRITAQALIAAGLLVAATARGDDCAALRARLDARPDPDPRHAPSVRAPWLRRDPFLAAELERAVAAGDAARIRPVLESMAALDARAQALQALQVDAGDALERRADACRRAAVARLLDAPARLDALVDEPLPALYLGWRRLLGGYVFARPFLRAGAARWRERERAAIAAGRPPIRFIHRAREREPMAATERAALIRVLRESHPLAWPVPDATALRRLAGALAPELATSAAPVHARVGRLAGAGKRPDVDPSRPRAYLDHGLVRWGDHVLLQLSWTFWFTERPRSGPLDPYGGAVDGLVLRATLGDDGRPLVWESIHPCGCYYTLAIPADRPQRYAAPDPALLEPPLVLDAPPSDRRLRAFYTPGDHYLRALEDAATAPAEDPGVARSEYESASWDALLAEGPDRPPFGADGLLRGSERGERFFLWPSGIRSPGAMRTPGRHATAFMGKRRFETAELLEERLHTPARN